MDKTNKKLSIRIIILFLFAITVTSTTYAFLDATSTNNNATGEGGCFQVSYSGEAINNENIISTIDYKRSNYTTVTLSKDSSCKIYTEANIYLQTNEATTLPITTVPALKYKIVRNDGSERNGVINQIGDTLLATVPLTDSQTTYKIYIWVDSNISNGAFNDKSFVGKIYANSIQSSTVDIDRTPPTLFLYKETYKDEDISQWTLENATVDNNGVLTLSSTSSVATSNYIKVNGGSWYPTFDGYVEDVSPRYSNQNKGGIYWETKYFDTNYNETKCNYGFYGNGWAVTVNLNEWNNDLDWYSGWKSNLQEERWGADVKYVKLSFKGYEYDGYNSPPPIKIRNLKIHGEEIQNSFYDIYVKSNDDIGVTITKYAKGEHEATYFSSSGTTVSNNKVTVNENGIYTFYVQDAAGNNNITTIEITSII